MGIRRARGLPPRSERFCRRAVVCIDEAWAAGVPVSFVPQPYGGGSGMHSVFYIIGVIVVVLAVLSLLGLG
jgi:hypothetical protein